jgi:hypothetical protein
MVMPPVHAAVVELYVHALWNATLSLRSSLSVLRRLGTYDRTAEAGHVEHIHHCAVQAFHAAAWLLDHDCTYWVRPIED